MRTGDEAIHTNLSEPSLGAALPAPFLCSFLQCRNSGLVGGAVTADSLHPRGRAEAGRQMRGQGAVRTHMLPLTSFALALAGH
jgi:hypothetical protein